MSLTMGLSLFTTLGFFPAVGRPRHGAQSNLLIGYFANCQKLNGE
jgi:hypothetical protein